MSLIGRWGACHGTCLPFGSAKQLRWRAAVFSQNRGASDESGESAGTTGECRAIMFLQISHLFGFIMGPGERGKKNLFGTCCSFPPTDVQQRYRTTRAITSYFFPFNCEQLTDSAQLKGTIWTDVSLRQLTIQTVSHVGKNGKDWALRGKKINIAKTCVITIYTNKYKRTPTHTFFCFSEGRDELVTMLSESQ